MKHRFTKFSIIILACFFALSTMAQQRTLPQDESQPNTNGIQMTDGNKSVKDILFYDDFSDSNMDDWTVVGPGAGSWMIHNSNSAGGQAPQLILSWNSSFSGTSRLVSPIINTSGYTTLNLSLLQLINAFTDEGSWMAIETTSDGGVTWTQVWELYWDDITNNYAAFDIVALTTDVGSENFQFCFKYEDDNNVLGYWGIDNVKLSDEVISYDVSPNEILCLEYAIYEEQDLIISASIINYGQETVTFDTQLEILNGETVIFTSTIPIENLAFNEETIIDFEAWTAVEGANLSAKVTTLLSNDENPSNDQISMGFNVLPDDEYCIPTGACAEMAIDDFIFAGIENTGSGCSENGYGDFTEMQATAEIGSTYEATIISDDGMLMNTSIWIDFNQNFQFESSELILTDSMASGFGSPLVVDLQIPWEAAACITHMRVGAQFFSSTSVDPCATLVDGEWEDYTIVLTGGALQLDATTMSIDMYTAYEQGNIIPSATIGNFGVETATFPVTFTIDDGYSSTIQVTDLPLGESIEIEFDAWNASPGEYMMECTTNLDGDNNPDNNQLSRMISIAEMAPFKMVVGEEGTGTWCGNCPRGAVYMDSMAMKFPETWIGIAVHNGDPMTNTEYDANIAALINYGYPGAIVNRKVFTDPTGLEEVIIEAQDYIALADIAIENKTFNETTQELTFTLTSSFVSTVSNYRFSAVLIENGVTGTGSGYNQANYYAGGGWGPMGGYELLPDPVPAEDMVYEHVARAIIGGFEGVEASLPETANYGETHSYNFSTIVDEEWDMNNIEVIGMLIDYETGFINNGTVDYLLTGIIDMETKTNIIIYPNPAKDQLTISNANQSNISIYNINGQRLLEEQNVSDLCTLDISDLETGIYFIKVYSSNQIITRKLVIE